MSKQTRSARGVLVNFDVLKLKEQIASGPKPIVVQNREQFVDTRLRRRPRRTQASTILPLDTEQDTSSVNSTNIEPEIKSNDNPTADTE